MKRQIVSCQCDCNIDNLQPRKHGRITSTYVFIRFIDTQTRFYVGVYADIRGGARASTELSYSYYLVSIQPDSCFVDCCRGSFVTSAFTLKVRIHCRTLYGEQLLKHSVLIRDFVSVRTLHDVLLLQDDSLFSGALVITERRSGYI